MKYNERIREIREDNSLTQQKIADLLHIGQRTYSDYESGKTRIPIDNLLILAKFYDVSLDYITGASNIKTAYPKKISSSIGVKIATAYFYRIIEDFKFINFYYTSSNSSFMSFSKSATILAIFASTNSSSGLVLLVTNLLYRYSRPPLA